MILSRPNNPQDECENEFEEKFPFQVVRVSKNENTVNNKNFRKLLFSKKNFKKLIPKNANTLLILSAVGNMRTGKSTSLNNFLNQLTNNADRPFDEMEISLSETEGIHIYHVSFEIMIPHYQNLLMTTYGQKIDILLCDCEGTESNRNLEASKLFLLNMLVASVLHVHFKSALNQSTVNKICSSFTEASLIFEYLGKGKDEILPALFLLYKDTTETSWRNVQQRIPTIRTYEDLVFLFPEFKEYYEKFSKRKIFRVSDPNKPSDEVGYDVTNRNCNYWKDLIATLDESLTIPKLKTRKELKEFFKCLVEQINTNDLMNVTTELESYYTKLFTIKKNKLILEIALSSFGCINSTSDFNNENLIHEIRNNILAKTILFESEIVNSSCSWIYNGMSEVVKNELIQLEKNLLSYLEHKKTEYLKKFYESVQNTPVKEKLTYEVDDYNNDTHGAIYSKWKCCQVEDRNAKPCDIQKVDKTEYTNNKGKFIGGHIISTVLMFANPVVGFFSGIVNIFKNRDKEVKEEVIIAKHRSTFEEFCRDCNREPIGNKCNHKIVGKKTVVSDQETIKSFITTYSMAEWKDNYNRENALKFIQDFIDEIQLKNK